MLFRNEYGPRELAAIEKTFATKRDAVVYSNKKEWVADVDVDHVKQQILSGSVPSIIHRGYLIVFNVGQVWYSPTARVLEEMLVLRIVDWPGKLQWVVDALLLLGKRFGCTGVAVGTALQHDSRLGRIYQRLGFKPEAELLYRRI